MGMSSEKKKSRLPFHLPIFPLVVSRMACVESIYAVHRTFNFDRYIILEMLVQWQPHGNEQRKEKSPGFLFTCQSFHLLLFAWLAWNLSTRCTELLIATDTSFL